MSKVREKIKLTSYDELLKVEITDGLKEIVENDITGYLSDENDVLVDRCVDILKNEELYQRLHHKTLEKAADILDVESYKERLDRVYQQCK